MAHSGNAVEIDQKGGLEWTFGIYLDHPPSQVLCRNLWIHRLTDSLWIHRSFGSLGLEFFVLDGHSLIELGLQKPSISNPER